jgi:hypothetical protein
MITVFIYPTLPTLEWSDQKLPPIFSLLNFFIRPLDHGEKPVSYDFLRNFRQTDTSDILFDPSDTIVHGASRGYITAVVKQAPWLPWDIEPGARPVLLGSVFFYISKQHIE